MTISTTDTRISYSGNNVTKAFSFPYRFLAEGDLVVTLVNSSGVGTVQVLDTDYTVSGADTASSGVVTMVVAPASGETLIIVRSTEITQEVDYSAGDAFPAETHERALDRLTVIAQEQRSTQNANVRNPAEDSSSLDMTLPLASARAGTVMAFDESGEPVVGPDITSVESVATNIEDINTVAGIAANVTTVAGISSDVTTVAGISSDVTTVVTNITDIQNAEANALAAAASASEAADSETAAGLSETNAASSAAAALVSENNAADSEAAALAAAAGQFLDYTEVRYDLGTLGATATLDIGNGNYQEGVTGASNVTFTMPDAAPTGYTKSFTVAIKQGATPRTVAFTGVKWLSSTTAASTSASKWTLWTFFYSQTESAWMSTGAIVEP